MPHTEMHALRVPDELWEAAMTRAQREGVSLSAMIRKWLAYYTTDCPPSEQLDRITDQLTRLSTRMKTEGKQRK